ncbi:MAG: hypothetical protein GY888_14970, partial [Planctomycetaceae bacterium]|nr:hypothetical protein [Planctomycetaceae bacterium]
VYAHLVHHGDYEAAARQLSTNGYGNDITPVPGVDISALVCVSDDEEDEAPGSSTPDDPGTFPMHLLNVPGFVSEMSQFINETNYTEQPVLALAGSLVMQGFTAARKVREQAGARSNLNILAVAGTTCGKERARTVCKDLLDLAGQEGHYFERPGSYQSIQTKVAKTPQCFFIWDEMGQAM